MTLDFGIRMLNMVVNGKVDNISKPIESKRLDNAIINNSRYSTTRDIAWSTQGKWIKKRNGSVENTCVVEKKKDTIHNSCNICSVSVFHYSCLWV